VELKRWVQVPLFASKKDLVSTMCEFLETSFKNGCSLVFWRLTFFFCTRVQELLLFFEQTKRFFFMLFMNYQRQLPEVSFFFFFYFLLCICFLGSAVNTIYFLFFFERNVFVLLLSRLCFILFCVFHSVFPNFRFAVLSFFLNPFFENYCLTIQNSLEKKLEKKPLSVFFLFHSLVCFTFLHLFMVFFTGLDVFLEYVYQLLNCLRIYSFPLVLYSYLRTQTATRFYAGWEQLADADKIEKTTEFAKKVAAFLSENYQKNPKTTQLTFLLTCAAGSMLGWGA
jgi:hypothetical protein